MRLMTQSNGWQLAKKRLYIKINDINSVLGVDITNPNLINEIGAKQLAVKTILEWIQDIEGTASQHSSHQEILRKENINEYLRYEGN